MIPINFTPNLLQASRRTVDLTVKIVLRCRLITITCFTFFFFFSMYNYCFFVCSLSKAKFTEYLYTVLACSITKRSVLICVMLWSTLKRDKPLAMVCRCVSDPVFLLPGTGRHPPVLHGGVPGTVLWHLLPLRLETLSPIQR